MDNIDLLGDLDLDNLCNTIGRFYSVHDPKQLGYSVHCPVCDAFLSNMLPHLNDVHKWSFIEIADWLEHKCPTLNMSLNFKS